MSINPEAAHAQRVLSVVHGAVRDRALAAEADLDVAGSWRRCIDLHALDPGSGRAPYVFEAPQVRERQQALARLREVAAPLLGRLHRQLMNPGQAIMLTDAAGVIVDCLLHDAPRAAFQRAGLRLGADWSEAHEGTNGIGTCAVERAPVIICQHDHFRALHTGLTCTASPVFGPHGELLAVLDVSSTSAEITRQSQFHTLALINLTAKLVESEYFLQHYRQAWLLQLQEQADHLGGFDQALLACDDMGRVLAANQSALNRFRTTREQLICTRIDNWFDLSFERMLEHARPRPPACWPLRTRTGERLLALLRAPVRVRAARAAAFASESARGTAVEASATAGLPAPAAMPSATRAELADPRLAREFARAVRVFAHDVPVLIRGETGSGKEVFARAVHAASARADAPFVALNCAAIPEALIESELFGYVGGSFTGARREGKPGKLWLANGGTLFLDEIGDMPFAMQTRLLRVLEERAVAPLGGGEAVPLDIRVLSATHRDLRQRIAEGQFREDLYYRMNGLEAAVPALRERTDLDALMQALLDQAAGAGAMRFSAAAHDALRAYAWPGNVRQMRSVLRSLAALCDTGTIEFDDLPPEVRDAHPAAAEAPLDAAERHALRETLERCGGRVSMAARQLGVSRNTLYRKLKRHGLPHGK